MRKLLLSFIVVWAIATAAYHFLDGDERQRHLTPNSSIGPVKAFFALQSRMMNDLSDFVGSIADSFSTPKKRNTHEAMKESGLYPDRDKEESS